MRQKLLSKKEILFNPIAPNSTKRTNFSKDRFFLSTSLNFRNKQIDDFLQQKIPIMKRKKKLNSTILSTQRVTSPLFRMLTALSKDIDKQSMNQTPYKTPMTLETSHRKGRTIINLNKSSSLSISSSSQRKMSSNLNSYIKLQKKLKFNQKEKKYNVIFHDKSIREYMDKAYKPLNEAIEKNYSENKKIVFNEMDNSFNLYKATLINSSNFSSKNQYISKYIHLDESKQKKEEKEHNDKIEAPINKINPHQYVMENFKFKPKSIRSILYRNFEEASRQEVKCKWRLAVFHAITQIRRLKIKKISTIFEDPVYSLNSPKPYAHDTSYICFQAVRNGDKKAFMSYVRKNKFILLDYDNSEQTMLHWIAKRNLFDYISFAVYKGASINYRDITGKTPLHIACINNHIESVMVLLFELANPFIKDNDGKFCDDYIHDEDYYCREKNEKIRTMVRRAKLLYKAYSFGKLRKFDIGVRRGLYFLYVYEMKMKFSFKKYFIYDIKDRYNMSFNDYEINTIEEDFDSQN